MARPAAEITLAEMFEALEGPVAITACTSPEGQGCDLEATCGLKPNWSWINREILGTLRGISLQAMSGSVVSELRSLENKNVNNHDNEVTL